MVEFIPFDVAVHKEVFAQLNIEFITWIADQFRVNYQLDAASNIGQTIPEYVNTHLPELTSLKPPDGIIYLLGDEGNIVGMGAIRKLSDETGEIKRMYIRPLYRGRGYGKQMLNKLLEAGRELGCSTFRLETSQLSISTSLQVSLNEMNIPRAKRLLHFDDIKFLWKNSVRYNSLLS
jgi:GNAT superfamily N-acetyltransferase